MDVLRMLLLVAGLVCFILAAIGRVGKLNLVALGLACWITPAVLDSLDTL